jgi:hypothetical protein
VMLASALEGSGRMLVPCPNGYRGNVSAVCAPDAERWSDVRNECEREPEHAF